MEERLREELEKSDDTYSSRMPTSGRLRVEMSAVHRTGSPCGRVLRTGVCSR